MQIQNGTNNVNFQDKATIYAGVCSYAFLLAAAVAKYANSKLLYDFRAICTDEKEKFITKLMSYHEIGDLKNYEKRSRAIIDMWIDDKVAGHDMDVHDNCLKNYLRATAIALFAISLFTIYHQRSGNRNYFKSIAIFGLLGLSLASVMMTVISFSDYNPSSCKISDEWQL